MTLAKKHESEGQKQTRMETAILFPEGLPAFETHHRFLLVANEEEAPFLWLYSQNNPQLAFIMIDPFLIHSHYLPDIPDEDIQTLQIESDKEVFILSLVNIQNSPEPLITANLISPIVINWRKKIAKQVILVNHQHYSIKHRLEPAK